MHARMLLVGGAWVARCAARTCALGVLPRLHQQVERDGVVQHQLRELLHCRAGGGAHEDALRRARQLQGGAGRGGARQ